MSLLDEFKLMKGIQDGEQDNLINLLFKTTKQAILAKLPDEYDMDNFPSKLDYIVLDVSIKRFNQLDSEGTKSFKQGSVSYDWQDDFLKPYQDVFDKFYEDDSKELPRRGRMRWF